MKAALSPDVNPSMRLLRRLVACYPSAFRQRFEQEMLLTIQDRLKEEPGPDSTLLRLGFWLNLAADLVRSIFYERFTQWRQTMKLKSVLQLTAVALMAAWAVIWAWFIGKWFLLLPLMDPQKWLLGEDYSSTANSIFGAALFLIPFLALLTFVIPVLKVQTRTENGDGVLMFRLGRMGKAQALVSWACLGATVMLWGMVFVARMGWW